MPLLKWFNWIFSFKYFFRSVRTILFNMFAWFMCIFSIRFCLLNVECLSHSKLQFYRICCLFCHYICRESSHFHRCSPPRWFVFGIFFPPMLWLYCDRHSFAQTHLHQSVEMVRRRHRNIRVQYAINTHSHLMCHLRRSSPVVCRRNDIRIFHTVFCFPFILVIPNVLVFISEKLSSWFSLCVRLYVKNKEKERKSLCETLSNSFDCVSIFLSLSFLMLFYCLIYRLQLDYAILCTLWRQWKFYRCVACVVQFEQRTNERAK